MKKIKFLIFIIPFLFCLNVYADSIVPKYPYNGNNNTYRGTEIYNSGTANNYSIGTRYNGRLSVIEFFTSYSFNANTNYTITMNMATEDWRNHFMGPQVFRANSDGSLSNDSNWATSSVTFVSMKKIKFNISTGSTIGPLTYIRLYSTNISSTAFTGQTNWNLSSITIEPYTTSSGSGSSGSGSSGSGSSGSSGFDDSGIIDNQTQNTNDIIDNQNTNTSDIIENNNENTQQIIDNQNQNSEQTQNTINTGLNNCFITSSNKNIVGDSQYWEKGDISTSLGGVPNPTESIDNTAYIRTKYFIKVEPNTSYYFGYDNLGAYSIYFYKSDYSFKGRLGNAQQTLPVSFTTPSDVYYVKIAFRDSNNSYTISPSIVDLNQFILTTSSNHNYIKPIISLLCSSKLDNVNDSITSVGSNIVDSIGSTATDIITNQENNTNDIIDNQNENTQQIIDNQNQNNQESLDAFNNTLNDCYITSSNKNIVGDSQYWEKGDISTILGGLPTPTEIVSNIAYIRTKFFIKVDPNTEYYFGYQDSSSYSIYYYKSDYSFKGRLGNSQQNSPTTFTTPSDVYYVKIAMRKSNNSYDITPEYVDTNKVLLQKQTSTSTTTYVKPVVTYYCSSKLDTLNKNLFDETEPTIDITLDLDTSSPVSDLLTMPMTILNKILDVTDDSCSPYIMPFDFFGGQDTITFPCINLQNYLGSDVYNIVDTILCFYFCYEIGMMCITIYEGITSLRDGFDSLYTPKHHDTSTRVGRGEVGGLY